MTDEGKSLAVPKESEAGSLGTNTANMSLVDAKDTIEGSTSNESTKERPAGAFISRFRHLSVSPRPRDSTPPAHRNSPGGSAVSTTPDSTSSQQQLHSISPQGLAGIPTAQERRTPEAGSPATSQVSIGSVPPSLAASLLPGSTPRHYDLTPVTRNTSELLANQYADATSNPIDDGYGNLVSPEDQDVLFGEHLTFPADLSGPDTTGFTGPSIPKLRSAQRAQSVGSLDKSTILKASAGQAMLGELHEECAIPDPIQFPARKFYSFTSRQQYDLATQGQVGDDDSTEGHVGLEPYQPSRQDDAFGGVGAIPEEELRGIFIARRRGTNGSGSGGESHANHRLLNPIPMDERQWSIPSIHMAQSLQGTMTSNSYTEHTDYEDEDESLLYVRCDDDASLSSRCSSLYLPDETAGEPLGSVLPMPSNRSAFPRHILQPQVVMNPQVLMEHSAQRDQAEDNDDNDLDQTGHAVEGGFEVDRRKRKQRKREERAFEWLQSVQGNGDVLAEAASSKFLTGNRRQAVAKGEGNEFAATNLSAYGVPDPQVPVGSRKTATPEMLRRQASSPSISENAARSY
jgi:hypothetical protein